MAAPWISSPEMAMRDPGQGGRHRQTGDGRRRRASSDVAMRARGRWPPPATGAIVGNGDAAARRARLVVSASSDAAMLERGEKKPPRGVRGGKSACGSGRKKPRRRSGRKTARPDVQLGHFSRIFRLIRCERPAVGAARSAVAFSRRASAPGAAARRAALLQS